jgi:hypothetical protein
MCPPFLKRVDEDSININYDYNVYFDYCGDCCSYVSHPLVDFANGASVTSTSQVRVSHFIIADHKKLISKRLEWSQAG